MPNRKAWGHCDAVSMVTCSQWCDTATDACIMPNTDMHSPGRPSFVSASEITNPSQTTLATQYSLLEYFGSAVILGETFCLHYWKLCGICIPTSSVHYSARHFSILFAGYARAMLWNGSSQAWDSSTQTQCKALPGLITVILSLTTNRIAPHSNIRAV